MAEDGSRSDSSLTAATVGASFCVNFDFTVSRFPLGRKLSC